jgi:hypothetical protein
LVVDIEGAGRIAKADLFFTALGPQGEDGQQYDDFHKFYNLNDLTWFANK